MSNNFINKIFYGDNLDVMEEKIPNKSIDLIGTMENNKADMAGFICYAKPTKDMLNEARKAGYFKLKYGLFEDVEYPKVQILTIEDILNNKEFKLPFTKLEKKS